MSEAKCDFPGFIKELCYFCYIKNYYHSLKIYHNTKQCESNSCNQSKVIYVNAKNYCQFVRDFQNKPKFSNKSVMKCYRDMSDFKTVTEKWNHIQKCTYSHNEFEYLMWNLMIKKQIYSISEIYKTFFEPYIYSPITESVSFSRDIVFKPADQRTSVINPIPHTKAENEIYAKDDKRQKHFCWFCLKYVTGESDIKRHIEGKTHKDIYVADRKRRWYFKMPVSSIIVQCSKNDCECDNPHSEDEFQEMTARIKYRNFMTSFTSDFPENIIYPWPKLMEFSIPKFPNNIKSYKTAVIAFAKLVITREKCKGLQVFLKDDGSRPFFKLVKCNENHILDNKCQLLKIQLNPKDKKSEIEFGIEFHPLYSSTYCQRIEFELSYDFRKSAFCKGIRVDVGTNDHIENFKNIWEKYSTAISRKVKYCSYVPFDTNEITRRGILNENLLGDVFKIITNLNWVQSYVKHYNYLGWMRDMMVFEELEQRLLLSKSQYNAMMLVRKGFQFNDTFIPANNGKLFGEIKYDKTYDWQVRDLIMKTVTNCYISFRKSIDTILFECELVDSYRYPKDTRTIDGVFICLSEELVNTIQIKNNDSVEVSIYFTFDRLVFDRRHESLNNIPTYDKLSYNPLICPFITRLPCGIPESEVIFEPNRMLNKEQRRLPKLVLRKLNPGEVPLPFILDGAFGTGKSLVLAETIMSILRNDQCPSLILICTRSYSAGKLYLEIFKERIPNFINRIKLLQSDHKIISEPLGDMIIHNKLINQQTFVDNRVFITTLDNAPDSLTSHINNLKKMGCFKYIFVDEASQVLEADALMVYQFGDMNTKFIFAGDIHQMRPNLYNRDLKAFSIPIISRLHNSYSQLPDYKIYLDEIYRTHPKIVEYLKNAIYCKRPLTSSMIPIYPELSPMKFTDSGSTVESFDYINYSFQNSDEVNLVIAEVKLYIEKLKIKNNYKRILVCTPFYSQIKLLRNNLRREQLGGVTVEMPSNIQGGEFDAVFISTVLTAKGDRSIPITESTFHINKGLINLVVSRARHIVVVVGDKASLTRQKSSTAALWTEFLNMCQEFS